MFSQTSYSQFHTKSHSDLTLSSPKGMFKMSNRSIFASSINNHKEEQIKLIKTKKKVKAKLMYLINTQLLTEQAPKVNSVEKGTLFKEKKKVKVIITNTQPNLIGKDLKYTNRINDNYILPSELIYKNFKDQDVELIGSDPEYFKPKKYEEEFETVDILRKRKLLDILNKEELIEERKLKKSNFKSLSISAAEKNSKGLKTITYLPGITKSSPSVVKKEKKTLLQTIYPSHSQVGSPTKLSEKYILDFNTISIQKLIKFKQFEGKTKIDKVISKGEIKINKKKNKEEREKVLEISEKLKEEKQFIRNCISEIKNSFPVNKEKKVRKGVKKSTN